MKLERTVGLMLIWGLLLLCGCSGTPATSSVHTESISSAVSDAQIASASSVVPAYGDPRTAENAWFFTPENFKEITQFQVISKDGTPIVNANVNVHSAVGFEYSIGITDANGIASYRAYFPNDLDELKKRLLEDGYCIMVAGVNVDGVDISHPFTYDQLFGSGAALRAPDAPFLIQLPDDSEQNADLKVWSGITLYFTDQRGNPLSNKWINIMRDRDEIVDYGDSGYTDADGAYVWRSAKVGDFIVRCFDEMTEAPLDTPCRASFQFTLTDPAAQDNFHFTVD